MENNKLLIGIQFTERIDWKISHTNIELYVVRDLTLLQLLDGVKYGLYKLAKESSQQSETYKRCLEVFSSCISKREKMRGEFIFPCITLTSFNAAASGISGKYEQRIAFSDTDLTKSISDLGFVTSSRLIFDLTESFEPMGKLDTENVIRAFNPSASKSIFFPEYNISSRQLYQFDTTPVTIIPPTDPPAKPDLSLISMLLPSIVSVGMLMVIRIVMSSSQSGSGLMMILMSAAMGVSAFAMTLMNWSRQKKQYVKDLGNWRTQYESYIDSLAESVVIRQERDRDLLAAYYPDMLTLINPDDKGVYSLNENIYSRAYGDQDFLSFRIGISDNVPSIFKIEGESKDTVFSDAFFEVNEDKQETHFQIRLRDELDGFIGQKHNLCELPGVMAQKYANMPNAPLMYSLKNKGCLGIVDHSIGSAMAKSDYFISRMIFELCYYHSPEDLQFVVFFNPETSLDKMEDVVNPYKFMPHFRGLFPDKSQFVFDQASAHMVMNNLLTILGSRNEQDDSGASVTPHIVVIVLNEHGLKEHAFAEYLPSAPDNGKEYENRNGLTFVYAVKYKEYLPAYCDDIVSFDTLKPTLTPRFDVNQRRTFQYDIWDKATDKTDFYKQYIMKIVRAHRFLSAVYYAQIAQNGKVPSAVSVLETMGLTEGDVEGFIRSNWKLDGKASIPSIMESLRVPIGKTETGTAYLDLHEKSDGPHMLVAGTTGSGKTETVISFLLGLCMQYRPDEINLLLVDMKGGGFTKRIGHLPHVVGAVTDVDGDENGTGAEYMLGRFLNAMKSEIKRRKLLFNKMHVDNIDAYIQACQNIEAHIVKKKITDPDEISGMKNAAQNDSLAHLFLVVDEFTELKRFTTENSDVDFMGEITTIARIGRSLGFHILLISQNIEGAITDDIRVNSKARLCLKVATRQASKEMIGTELAASPHMPGNGRAYLLVGTGSKFEYFQSAYSGAEVDAGIPVEITLASKTGQYRSFYRSDKDNLGYKKKIEKAKAEGTSKTQLELITETIVQIYKQECQTHYPKPRIVFSSPLSTCIAWDSAHHTVIDLSKRKKASK